MEEKERTYRLQRETPTPIPPQAISLHPITTTPQSYYTIPLQTKIGQNKQKIQSSSSRNFGDSKLPNSQVPGASNQGPSTLQKKNKVTFRRLVFLNKTSSQFSNHIYVSIAHVLNPFLI